MKQSYTNAEKIINSILSSGKNIALHLDTPLQITVCFAVIMLVYYMVRYRHNFTLKRYIPRVLKYSVFALYVSFIVEITLLQRIGHTQSPPFSEIWTSWSIFETDKIMYIDSTPIVNNIMFVPMAFMLWYIFGIRKKIVQKSILSSFVFSVAIESCQVIFRLGTLQVSDLVYNTLGGAIGAGLLILTIKIINKRKEKKNV